MKSVLVISFSDLARDPRVSRQIHFLKDDYRVSTLGYADSGIPGVRHIPCPPRRKSLVQRAWNAVLLKAGRFDDYYWDERMRGLSDALKGGGFDLIVANECDSLPLACAVAGDAAILHDAHEYAPEEMADSRTWRFFYSRYRDDLCRRFLPRCRAVTTVAEGIAGAYRRRFHVDPVVVTNAGPYQDLAPSSAGERAIRMVHHGAAIPSRRIQDMIRLLDLLDGRFTLDLMLVPGDTAYLKKLEELARGKPRVRLVPPRAPAEIPSALNSYDIGLYILPPVNFNNTWALPNKIFEFIQARLALAVSPSPEMASIVERYGCGVVAADFTALAMAATLNSLDAERVDACKRQSHLAAGELCAERNRGRFLALVRELLPG